MMETLQPHKSVAPSCSMEDGEQSVRAPFRAQQACNECRRRKGKCDRIAPECGSCSKYGRHCLYQQHSKSPLTRKHLTYVEHRLEAATAEVHVLRRKLHSLRDGCSGQVSCDTGFISPSTIDKPELAALNSHDSLIETQIDLSDYPNVSVQLAMPDAHLSAQESLESGAEESSNIRFEGPPTSSDDFDWDERDISFDSEWLEIEGEDTSFVDGMASLSIDKHDTGYLGIASGAALLRLLQPEVNEQSSENARLKHDVQKLRKRSPKLHPQPDPNVHIIDSMIDAYFRSYHISYPMIHESRFRAQYAEIIPRPAGKWKALVYMVAAVGAFSSTQGPGTSDVALFNAARSQLSINDLESGNISLVQTLTLISNYLQKRNKPNSGYNYLGLALRMAMGLGLHKEFPNWDITPLQMEIRRRVWWTLFVFDIGATITFSRPVGWPHEGIEVALPLNIHDRNLTAAVNTYPPEADEVTTYSAVRAQVTFHLATNCIYTRVITVPFPTSKEVISLDQQHLVPWLESLPSWYSESTVVPSIYSFSHAVMMWRYHNLRLIMYRPFLLRLFLLGGRISDESNALDQEACRRCMDEATRSVNLISDFWKTQPHTKMASWYALYFLFQASLVPVFCLRNNPHSESAPTWRHDIKLALDVIESMFAINSSSVKCFNTIHSLCTEYLWETATSKLPQLDPTDDSPQMQISEMYPMMWPNVQLAEADVAMQDDAWRIFLEDVQEEGEVFDDTAPESWTFP